MLSKNYILAKYRNSLSDYSLPVLFIALAIWIIKPIIGIFGLLLFLQLDSFKKRSNPKSNSFLNNTILIVIIITISIYISSFEVFGDTKRYIYYYQSLGEISPFEMYFGGGLEFVTFLLAYPIYYLSNGSSYWFLLNQTIIINTLVVFISKNLSNKYYGLLLILVFSTAGYYSQLFYMRQFISIVFLMAAVASFESKISFWFYLFLATFSHLSTIIYSSILLASKFLPKFTSSKILKKTLKSKKIRVYLKYILLVLFLLAVIMIVRGGSAFINQLVTGIFKIINLGQLSTYLEFKFNNFSASGQVIINNNYFISKMIILNSVVVGMFILFRKYKIISPKSLSLILIYLVTTLLMIFTTLTGFSGRIALLGFSLIGFFYTIGLEAKKNTWKWFVWIMVAINLANFMKHLSIMSSSSYFSFFEGRPLEMTLYEYIVFFINSINQ